MLHVHVGDSSAEALRASGVPGEVIVWGDPVMLGPTPAGLSPETWRETRARFLAGTASHSTPGVLARHLAGQDAALGHWQEHEEVVLWFDACLFDQTILIRLLDWFSQRDLAGTRLSLICVGEFPGIARFDGLGQLGPQELASLFPSRQGVTGDQFNLARQAWAAYCAPEPRQVERVLHRSTSPLPYLAGALRRHLQQFPWVGSGLDRLEREALSAIAAGHTSPGAIFARVSEQETPAFLGDTMLWTILEDLAGEARPLISIAGPGPLPRFDDPAPPALSAWSLSLTDFGRAVLAGIEDRVRLNGIERWVGGVHLQGAGPIWRWDERSGSLVRE